MNPEKGAPRQSNRMSHWIVLGLIALVAAGLEIYAQMRAFAWDEGFHLVAAQSINRGKRPYLDFCFPQTPLNAYWNAGWMRVFGDTWRTAHGVAAVMTTLAVLATARYLLRRFPAPGWRLAAAAAAVCCSGLNIVVVEYGAIAQAYALCLFLIVTAFLFTVAAVDREGVWSAGAAGFLAGAAANSSLLTAPVAPVLLVWMLFCNRAGNRWAKLGAFAVGGAMSCAPLAWLFTQGPRQTIFNVLHYNLLYRQRQWEGAVAHNFGEWFAWVSSPQALMLGGLALAGLLFVRKRSGWERALRREFYLCAWLAVALMAHISTATPTFRRYYLLAVPFLAILACAGLYDVGSRLGSPGRPWWPVLIVSLLTGACLAKTLIEGHEDFSWYDVEPIAAKVRQVTPPQAVLFADEPTYFVTRHVPPLGMELEDSHKLDFPPAMARQMHVIPQAELDRQIKAGAFDTVEMSDDDDRVDKLGLRKMYVHSAKVGDYDIFWGKAVVAQPSGQPLKSTRVLQVPPLPPR
jgi:4-amino-4-deoxy-L-arabinose transferase-like glycosyltransferase